MLASVVQAMQGCQARTGHGVAGSTLSAPVMGALLGLAVLPLSPFCTLGTQNQELLGTSKLLPLDPTLALPAEVVCLDNVLPYCLSTSVPIIFLGKIRKAYFS